MKWLNNLKVQQWFSKMRVLTERSIAATWALVRNAWPQLENPPRHTG